MARRTINEVFRDFSVDGNPDSGEHEPIKADIRDTLNGEFQDAEDSLESLSTTVTNLQEIVEGLQVSGDTVTVGTWAELQAMPGTREAQRGEVTGPDGGTHTDPVVGGTVANVGIYSWSTAPAGWKWLTANDFATLTNEVTDARQGETSLENRINSLAFKHGTNLIIGGRLDRGAANPTFANDTPVTETPESVASFQNRGLTHCIVWPTASAEFARYVPRTDEKAQLFGKYVCGGFIEYTVGTPHGFAVVRLEGTGDDNINIDDATHSFRTIDTNTRLVYEYGQMPDLGEVVELTSAAELVGIRVGFTSNPSASPIYASAFFLAFRDTPWTVADMPALQKEVVGRFNLDRPTLVLNGLGPNESFIGVRRGNDIIKRGFVYKSSLASPILASGAYPHFNFTSDWINGIKYRAMNDDVAPYLVNGAHLGGQHATNGGRVTMVAHGKDNSDLGSIWANGGNQYVLIRTLGVNQLLMVRRGTSAVPPTGTYTHVSGAAHTADIVVTTSVVEPFHPMSQNNNIRVIVDGQEIGEENGVWEYNRSVSFVETYEVLDREEVIDWYIAQGPAGGNNVSGDPLFSVSITYEYDTDANLTIYSDFLVMQTLSLSYMYGIQVVPDDALQYYVPKAIPFVHDGLSRDYALKSSYVDPATEVLFNGSNTEAGGLYLDRFMTLTTLHAMASGFAPLQIAEPTVRRSTYALPGQTGLQIATTGKVYMRAVNKGIATQNPGDYFSWVSYRNLIVRDPARTALYPVRTREADFLYADWHDLNKFDRLQLPADFIGRPYTLVEKSANVDILSTSANGSIMTEVTTSGTYGYMVLRFDR